MNKPFVVFPSAFKKMFPELMKQYEDSGIEVIYSDLVPQIVPADVSWYQKIFSCALNRNVKRTLINIVEKTLVVGGAVVLGQLILQGLGVIR